MRMGPKPLLLALFTFLAWGQDKPNFSGRWKLNAAESDFSDKRAAVPDSLFWTIQQKGEHLAYKVELVRQGKNGGFELDADIGGAPFESDAAGLVQFKRKGSSLTVYTLYNPGQDRETSMEEIWTLSLDGRKLVDELIFHVPKNAKTRDDVHIKRVFDKQ